MKNTKFVCAILLSLSSSAFAGLTSVKCGELGPVLNIVTSDAGCRLPSRPYFENFELHTSEDGTGSIEVSLNSVGGGIDPNCDNPRGQFYKHELSFPALGVQGYLGFAGTWAVYVDGTYLASVSLSKGGTCSVSKAALNF